MLTQEGELEADIVAALGQRTAARAFVVSGPSGCGKSHLMHNVSVSQVVRQALGPDGCVVALRSPYELIAKESADLALQANVLLFDNFDLCVNIFAELELHALLPTLFKSLASRRTVAVFFQRSAEVWKAITQHFETVVNLRVRQPGQLTLRRIDVDKVATDADEVVTPLDGPTVSWRNFAAAALYTADTRRALSEMVTSDGVASTMAGLVQQRGSNDRALRSQLDLVLRRHGCHAAFEEVCRIVKLHITGSSDRRGPVAAALPTSTGVLLHGDPGCGKSLLIALLRAHLTTVPFFITTGPAYFSQYLGDTEQRLRETFALAKSKAPSVLVIEDIDAIAATRGKTSGGGDDGGGGSVSVTRRILASLLCEMDGVGGSDGVLVIGTTSRITEIDAAVLRQGRLETHVYLGPLTEANVVKDAAAAWLERFAFATADDRDESVRILASRFSGQPSAAFEKCVRHLTEAMLETDEAVCSAELVKCAALQ